MNKLIRIALPLACLLAVPAVLAADAEVIRLSEPVAVTNTHEVFGSLLPDAGVTLQIGDLIENGELYEGKEVLVSTRIAKVCQKKGCFFVAQHGADTVRVTFEDYGFFIPTDSGGKTVTLLGTYSRKPLSREEAEHLAEDLGEEAPETVPEFEYSIVAKGVSIPLG